MKKTIFILILSLYSCTSEEYNKQERYKHFHERRMLDLEYQEKKNDLKQEKEITETIKTLDSLLEVSN